MRCSECSEICLQLDLTTSTQTLLRQYDSVRSLQSAASSCDLCSLFSSTMSWLCAHDTAPYCRAQWGEQLWQHLLATSKLSVYHVLHGVGHHNIEIQGLLDAERLSQFAYGSKSYGLRTCLGGICVAEGSSYSHLVHGRPATFLRDQKSTIELLSTKYKTCLDQHEQCRACKTRDFAPAKLLSILEDKVVISDTSDLSLEYATLSYCWGNSNTVRLTKDNFHLYSTEGLALDKLPLTIRNAVELCAGIGIGYLWVDCLCILQDSNEDWVANFSMITTIFNSSMINIKASAGSDSHYGLFKPRSVWTQKGVELRCKRKADTDQICMVREPLERQRLGTADDRAWILEEDLLARRVIIFTPSQVLWQCCSSVWTESGITLRQVQYKNWIFPRPPLGELGYADTIVDEDPVSLPDWRHSRLWERIVKDYCSRQMTFPSDKLPALSAVADWISTHPSFEAKSHYFAGLWEAHLPGCLLWHQRLMLPDYTNVSRLPVAYRAPSWSWAANDGTGLTWLDWRQHAMKATIQRVTTELQDAYEFGRVLGGNIEMTAQMKRGSLIQMKHTKESFGFCDEGTCLQVVDQNPARSDSYLGVTYFDSIEYNKAWLGYDAVPDHKPWTCACVRISEVAGLLVEAVDIEYTGFTLTFRRIGLAEFFPDSASDWWSSASQSSIRLI